ncbi:C2H2 and C2HC zinc fingers superfamily protein [Hibiscus syriacus]|uniref:C2H2 and C2HC zinc fingers superfamily protein n=1 Tax=Hibiscus syriacus TaxID=106335 RepID=A0A6A2YGJ6_HIBSY|nr:C2H2 and C2HC zinc fingers superfamily protein [Hibiscus syriacus]
MAEEKERKIPVFTVVKNGAILKNIFVIKNPRDTEDEEDPHVQESEVEEILVVGRHPDCNIMLTHPSISRFHLQIHSRPSSQKLSIVDLSSVHGTWVSGKKIDPGVAVELSEGDTIKLGGSTRVYKLHWIPMCRAYDMENPFVSAMDMAVEEEKEEERAVESHLVVHTLSTKRECGEERDSLMVEKKEETSQTSMPAEEKELFSMDSMLEGSGLVMNREIPSASSKPENMNFSTYETENSPEKRELSELETYSATVTVEENQQKMDGLRVSAQPRLMESIKSTLQDEAMVLNILKSKQVHEEKHIPQVLSALKPREETENKENAATDGCNHYLLAVKVEDADDEKLSRKDFGSQHTGFYSDSLSTESVKSSLPVAEDDERSPTPHSLLAPALPVLSESENLDGSRVSTQPHLIESFKSTLQDEDIVLNILKSQQVREEKQIPQLLSALKLREETENEENAATDGCNHFLDGKVEDADDEKLSRKDYGSQHTGFYSVSLSTESVNSSVMSESENLDGSRVPTQPHLMESIKSTLRDEDMVLNVLKSQQVHEEKQIPQLLSALKQREETENKENAATDGCNFYLARKAEDADDEKLLSQHTGFYSVSHSTESVNSSLPIAEDDKRSSTPHSLLAPTLLSESENLDGSPLRLETKSNFQSIWSRRGKPASVLHIQTGKCGADENKRVPKSLFVSSEDEEEIFTPDKENFTPNTLLMKVLKRNDKLDETKHSSSKVTCSPHLQAEDDVITLDKENQTPKLIKEHKYTSKASRNQPKLEQQTVIKGKAERGPFQPLLVDSACETVSEALDPNTSVQSCKNTILNTKKIEKRIGYPSLNKSVGKQRTWTMVADTSSLVDEESRKSLKLLQGLKGTLLIIPRMVIRELDCLKRRGTLFRRTNEASSVLEWVEECMVKTKWWIHVQSTTEEEGPIAPTPPATTHSHFSEGSMFGPFSARGNLMEIATPTAQDHILDYALLHRKMSNGDGQLVLLSNDITLKIKAMAEGLICETVQEFRESLVNPFSERFMWADSSPRGHTWSVMDDVVLRDKYNRCPLRKQSKGDIKGLKLILLHNSLYGQIRSFR